MIKTISFNEIKECVLNGDSSFIGCKVESLEGMYKCEDGTYESGDYIEGEGGRELVCDANGICIGFYGYYYEISSEYNGEK